MEEPSPAEETWYLISGELYLPAKHRLVSDFKTLIGSGIEASAAIPQWVSGALAKLAVFDDRESEFFSGTAGLPTDLYGPLPTGALVMQAAVEGRGESELLEALGGKDARYEISSKDAAGIGIRLAQSETRALSGFDEPAKIEHVLRLAPDRGAALRSVVRLREAGLIERRQPGEAMPAQPAVSKKLMDNFLRRIREDLLGEPLDLDPQEHREMVAGLLGKLGGMNFFELLNVPVGSSGEEIHDGYARLARIVHPRHAATLGLDGKEAGLQLLFEKATEAYVTLSDQERSRAYLLELDTQAILTGRFDGEDRQDELDELAEAHFSKARAAEAREDYHSAIELLQQAVRSNPKPEYYALLGRCQMQNPKWIDKAVATFERAIELDPDDADLRAELGRGFEELGHVPHARAAYKAAIDRMPTHAEAAEGLERLDAKRKSGDPASRGGGEPGGLRGLLGRLFGR